MSSLTAAQQFEIAKYEEVYETKGRDYRMKDPRKGEAEAALREMPWRGSYLDVSAGWGEMLGFARTLGFERVAGTEVVPALLKDDVRYALAWDLPFDDGEFEVVTLFDVIEHILQGDDERVCRELARVASKAVLITTNNHPGWFHINIRDYDEWHRLFEAWFAPGDVRRIEGRAVSKMWRISF